MRGRNSIFDKFGNVYGNNFAVKYYSYRHPAWKAARETAVDFCQFFREHGGDGEVMTLPDLGITGNSHMMMMEYNNYEIADLIEAWLIGHGLTAEP